MSPPVALALLVAAAAAAIVTMRRRRSSIALRILAAMALGFFAGLYCKPYTPYYSFLGTIFMKALFMIITPLILASLVCGMASLGDMARLGRIATRTIAVFLFTTFLAVLLGMALVTLIQPGRGVDVTALRVTAEITKGEPSRLLRAARKAQGEEKWLEAATLADRLATRYQGYPAAEEAVREAAAMKNRLLRQRPREVTPAALAAAAKKADQRAAVEADPQLSTVGGFLRAQIDKSLQNPFRALAETNVMAIIVFALLLGGMLAALKERGKPLLDVFTALNDAMMGITHLVMLFAPFGVFALMAEMVSAVGLDAVRLLAKYMATVVIGLAIHGGIVLPLVLLVLGRVGPLRFFAGMRDALVVAFSTASSNATLPVTLECVQKNLGVTPRVSGFVVTLGATINMDGTALYEAVAAIFIAQLFGVPLDFTQQCLIFITATLAAIGAAGIPSAGTVTMVMVLTAVGLPLEGIGIILAVDRILDMCRTTVNVQGDGIVSLIIQRWEGNAEEPADSSVAHAPNTLANNKI